MKRSLALLTSGALLAMPFAADAAPKKPKNTKRTVTFNYTGGLSVTVVSGASAHISPCALPQCFEFDTVKGEKSITLSAKDQSGLPLGLQIWQDDDYEGSVSYGCGTATVKVSAKSAHSISVRPAISGECQSAPTQGAITAVITNY